MPARVIQTLALLAIVGWVGAASATPPAPLRGRPAVRRPAAMSYQQSSYQEELPAPRPEPPSSYDEAAAQPDAPAEWDGTYEEGAATADFYPSNSGFGDDSCGQYCDEFGCGEGMIDECGPVWFTQAEVLLMDRSTAPKKVITQTPQVFSVGTLTTIVQRELQTTRSFDFGFQPGLRATLGRHLGTDLINRDHTLELTYFGLQEWQAKHEFVGDRVDSVIRNSQGQLEPILLGRLNTPFPINVGGFNRADVHAIQNYSTLNNFELNYRIRKRLRGGQLVGWPDGTWTRQPVPGRTPSMLIGLRYISLNDHFNWASRGSIENLVTGAVSPIIGNYNTRTSNDLLGLQIGGDFVYSWGNASLGFRGKTGLYGNVTRAYTHMDTQADPTLFILPQRDFSIDSQRMSFVGELGIVGTWDITPNFSLRAAYDLMWIQGIALAPEQIQYDLQAAPSIFDSGYLFFQGISAGCELRW